MDVGQPNPEIDRVVDVERPRGAARPLVVEIPHAGLLVPEAVRPELLLDEDGLRRDADLYVDELYARAADLGAIVVRARLSRFVVDLNRDPDDVDRLAVPDHPRARERAPRGLLWRLATDGTPALAAPLPLASWERRVRLYHAPYHAAIDAAVDETRRRFGRVIVLSGHSMPSVGRAGHSDTGSRRADVVPGDRLGQSCAPEVTFAATRHFESAGLEVRANDPYLGGNTTVRLGRPADGVHAIQIELNRDLYMDERTFARTAAFARVADLCAGLVDRLGQIAANP